MVEEQTRFLMMYLSDKHEDNTDVLVDMHKVSKCFVVSQNKDLADDNQRRPYGTCTSTGSNTMVTQT